MPNMASNQLSVHQLSCHRHQYGDRLKSSILARNQELGQALPIDGGEAIVLSPRAKRLTSPIRYE